MSASTLIAFVLCACLIVTIGQETFSLPELENVQSEGHAFQAEINRLMDIIVKSLYSSRDIFIRELISNAADACDKIRYLSLGNPSMLSDYPELEILVRVDKENKKIYIRDSGIGMTKAELISNLGSVAKSGTSEFLAKIQDGGDSQLIGQFGVGFYSSFLVADKVTVVSKSLEDDQYIWESKLDSAANFAVAKDPRGNTLGRGTMVILHIKEDAEEFLDASRLERLIQKYNEFVTFPIKMWKSHEEERDVPIENIEEKDMAEVAEELNNMNVEEEVEGEEKEEIEKIKETVWAFERINNAVPIWRRPRSDVTDEEYEHFYTDVLKDYSPPLDFLHFKAEGDVDFTALIYVPKNPPGDMMRFDYRTNLKLYVKRVFITDKFEDFIPAYLNFIKGIVDSDDLPLNVSREMLQQSSILEKIKKKLVRKILGMFQSLTENKEKWDEFYRKYHTQLKLGVVQDRPNMHRIAKLLQFPTAKTPTGEMISFEKYVESMKEGQDKIYYLGGESLEVLRQSPLLERIVKRGYDVFLLPDPIDEYAVGSLEKYDEKYQFVDISKDGLTLDEDDASLQASLEAQFEPLITYLKNQFSEKLSKVSISMRLTQSPVAIVSGQYGYSANMERIIKAQALKDDRYFPTNQKKVLEINPRHPIVKKMLDEVVSSGGSDSTADAARILYDVALLNSGFSLQDPTSLSGSVNRMVALALGVDPNATPEEEVFPQEFFVEHDEDHGQAEVNAEAAKEVEEDL